MSVAGDSVPGMKVGVYVDGYNLYYGARSLCGRGTPGWKWLDIRAVTELLLPRGTRWAEATIDRIVYCTARVDSRTNADAFKDQDIYLKALVTAQSVDWIEYGTYVARAKTGLLATRDPKTHRPHIATSGWPVMLQDAEGNPVREGRFLVQYLHLEEKGSDVNVAAHLLRDVLTNHVDAAMVVSNDSDLALPLRMARESVPLCLVNPQSGRLAGALKGTPTEGVGGHVWVQLQEEQLRACQLPDSVGNQLRPEDW